MRRSTRCFVSIVLGTILFAPGSAPANTGVVEEVLDGGTIRIGDFTARLTGLAVPDTTTSLGRLVHRFTAAELEGKLVRLYTWTTDNTAAGIVHDDTGLPFVTIEYGEDYSACINEVLLEKGYARVDPRWLPEDKRHYLDLERVAREKERGLWAGKGDRSP